MSTGHDCLVLVCADFCSSGGVNEENDDEFYGLIIVEHVRVLWGRFGWLSVFSFLGVWGTPRLRSRGGGVGGV